MKDPRDSKKSKDSMFPGRKILLIAMGLLCVLALAAFITYIMGFWEGDGFLYFYLAVCVVGIILSRIYMTNDIKYSRHEDSNYSEYRAYLLEELKQNEPEQPVDGEKKDCENKQQHGSSGEWPVQVGESSKAARNFVLENNDDIAESYEKRKADKRDIIALMLKNNDEITEYFTISKSQAKSSYRFSIITCIVGILMLGIAIYGAVVINNLQLTIIGTASGAITEVISGTVLWIHNKSALQLNYYYDALHENEKFLSAVNIADKLSEDKKEEMYIEIIRKQIESQIKQLPAEKKTDTKGQ